MGNYNVTEQETKNTEMEMAMQEGEQTGALNIDKNTTKKEKESSYNYTHHFKKPVTIEGKTYKTLTFYFEKLTGEDVEMIEAELQDKQQYILSPEISSVFQSMLASRAAGVASDEIKRLPLYEYMAIKNKAKAFLVGAGF